MKLDQWLSRENIKQKDFAASVGASTATISELINGKTWIGRSLAIRIAEFTNGEVTAHDFTEEVE
jgi:plasmid maintenance system antidote protein VapI